jgi:hypothetical protein
LNQRKYIIAVVPYSLTHSLTRLLYIIAAYYSSLLQSLNQRKDIIAVVPYFSDVAIDGVEWGVPTLNNTVSLHWKTSNWMKGILSSE